MKKLALLLGALSLVSSVAYAKEVVPAVEEVVVVEEAAPVAAAPALRVTNVGQYIEIDNTSGSTNGNIGNVMLAHQVGLAYGDDWTFGLMARKGWDMDTDDGIHSNGYRIDLDAWKKVNDNFSVGARWRQESDKDRYLLRTKYSYGMLSGWIDAGYESWNAHTKAVGLNEKNESVVVSGYSLDDNWYVEAMPVIVAVGPVQVGYYLEYFDYLGEVNASDALYKSEARHQVRLMAPLYTGEKLSLGAEYRYQFLNDIETYKDAPYQENNRHIGIINASYAVTDALSVYGYYEYDWNKYDGHDAKDKDDNYYGEFAIGWNYAF